MPGKKENPAADNSREKIEELRSTIRSLESKAPLHQLGKLHLKMFELLATSNRVNEGEESLLGAISNFEGAGISPVVTEYASALYRMGMLTRNKGSHDEARSYLERAFETYQEAGSSKAACTVLNDTGINLEMMGEIKEAILAYRRGLTIAKQNRYQELQMKFLFNTSVLLSKYPTLHREALRYNEEAAYLCRKGDDFRGLGYVLTNSAFLLHSAGSSDQAVKNAREALDIRNRHGTYYEQGFARLNLAGYLDSETNTDEQEQLYLEAREILHESGYAEKEINCFLGLVQIELERNNTDKANAYLESALEILSGIRGNETVSRNVHRKKYEVEKASGNWEAALLTLEQLENERESLNRERTARELKAVCAKWEVDMINMEKTLLQARNNELEQLNLKLERSHEKIEKLSGLLPLCANCGKEKNHSEYGEQLNEYLLTHYVSRTSQSLCGDCRAVLHPQAPRREK